MDSYLFYDEWAIVLYNLIALFGQIMTESTPTDYHTLELALNSGEFSLRQKIFFHHLQGFVDCRYSCGFCHCVHNGLFGPGIANTEYFTYDPIYRVEDGT